MNISISLFINYHNIKLQIQIHDTIKRIKKNNDVLMPIKIHGDKHCCVVIYHDLANQLKQSQISYMILFLYDTICSRVFLNNNQRINETM